MDEYRKTVIDPGDAVSKMGNDVRVGSFENSPAVEIVRTSDHFRGPVGYVWNDHVLFAMIRREVIAMPQSDGAGGKPQFFTLLGEEDVFRGLGWDVITMNADDVACHGGLPVFMLSSNIDVKNVTDQNLHLVSALMQGTAEALNRSHLVLTTGETAVMKHSITAFCDNGAPEQLILTWGATCLGLTVRRDGPQAPTVIPGMAVVGFKERGYRCNGGTALTNLIEAHWGRDVTEIIASDEARDFLRMVTIPSQSYAATLVRLNGWLLDGRRLECPLARIHGMAHITGGGVWGKFGELLPEGVGADLYSMPEPPTVLRRAQELSAVLETPFSDYKCYDTFHGGCGNLLICDPDDVDIVIAEAAKDGHEAQLVGETITSDDREIRIQSRFLNGGNLSSLHPPY